MAKFGRSFPWTSNLDGFWEIAIRVLTLASQVSEVASVRRMERGAPHRPFPTCIPCMLAASSFFSPPRRNSHGVLPRLRSPSPLQTNLPSDYRFGSNRSLTGTFDGFDRVVDETRRCGSGSGRNRRCAVRPHTTRCAGDDWNPSRRRLHVSDTQLRA